ncbi:hypothetical protein SAMN05421642_107146 [Rhodococcoides kyotonense]|uniref:Uncharacterized protein n=2 Tax=Rhodococcoides kyotonense TaxID=398843 RepID=A0A239IS01_9NOCA|nr:hypothetical protein SAMN05421642_107146 [Rhodococcus kyotonensis]
MQILCENGYKCTAEETDLNYTLNTRIQVLLPGANQSRRIGIAVPKDFDTEFDSAELPGWESLQRYNGIWSRVRGTAEVLLRSDRGLPPRWLMRRMLGRIAATPGDAPNEIVLSSPSGSETIRIGPPSLPGILFLAEGLRLRNNFLTLTLSGLDVAATHEQVEDLVEIICDSLMFDSDLLYGSSLTPARLELIPTNREPGSRRRHQSMPIQFPQNRYPHAVTVLYKSGRDRTTAPTIRYWAFYQVLEYFFPTYAMVDARRKLSRALRDPRFDIYNEDDVTKATQLLLSSGRGGGGSERDQLFTVIQEIAPEAEIREFLQELPSLIDSMADKESIISQEKVSIKGGNDLRRMIANRIYDIRCKIVHSKGDGSAERAGLIPGSHHDDAVRIELPLIEFLAQKAILASASKLEL